MPTWSATVWPAISYPGATNPSENGGTAPQPSAPDAVIPPALDASGNGGTAGDSVGPVAEVPPGLNPSENGGLAPAPSAVPITLSPNSVSATLNAPTNQPLFTTYIPPSVTQQNIYNYFGIVATAGSFYPPHGYFNKLDPAKAATVAALPAYTAIGPLVLQANANGPFPSIDNVSIAEGDVVLVKDESGALAPNNGVYFLDVQGTAGTPWALKRTAVDPELCLSDVTVLLGDVNQGSFWVFATDPATFNLGATDVIWLQTLENAYSNDPPRTGAAPFNVLYTANV